MAQLDLDEASLEKLAWIIAEEFVESGNESSRMKSAELRGSADHDPKLRLILAWGNPAIALPGR